MKQIMCFFAVVAAFSVQAQILSPQPSPSATVIQTVGLSEVTLKYSRPATRGRIIVGDLVPFNAIWRTGANANSTFSVNTPFEFAGTAVPAGTYALYSKPTPNQWTIYLYSKNDNWGTPAAWDKNLVVATASVTPQKTQRTMESFAIGIHEITNNGAHLEIAWQNTLLAVPFTVPTDATVMASIEKTLAGKPTANDYYTAAVYYLTAGKDISQSVKWIDTAMSQLEAPAFWQLRQQSLIYAKAGMVAKAIATAKTSLEGAKKAGNKDYVKMNTDSLKKWGAL